LLAALATSTAEGLAAVDAVSVGSVSAMVLW
jgi:hypothetical protein